MVSVAEQRSLKVEDQHATFDAVTLLTCYLFLLMAVPSSLVFAPLGAAGGPATLFAVALMITLLIMRLHPGFDVDKKSQPVRLAGIIFLCSMLAAYVAANARFLPTVEQNGADRGIISAIGWLAVLLVASDGIHDRARLSLALSRLSTGAAGLAAMGIAQFFTGVNYAKYIAIPGLTFNQAPTDLLIRGGFSRPSGTTAQPLEFAAVMVTVFPIALHQARFAPAQTRNWRWLKIFLIGAAIPMTVSRTALVGLTVIALVLLPTWPRLHRRYAYVGLLASVAAILVMVPRLVATFATLINQIFVGSSSTDSRITAIGQSVPSIEQHPWFGSGFGTFPPQMYFFTDDQYLSSLITTGFVGLACLLALLLTGWCVARSLRRRSRDREVKDLAQSLAASVAVAIICFGTFDALGFAVASGITFLMIGCAGAAYRLHLQATDL